MSMKQLMRRTAKAVKLGREPLWRRGLRLRVAASIEHDRLPLRRDFRTVIDVGANRGQFALYSRVRFPDATIYCFEPLRAPREKLERLFADDSRVTVFAVAAGAHSGEVMINVSRQNDSSSLLPAADLQAQRFPGTEMVGTEEIAITTLDVASEGLELTSPVLLKLDVQGFELEALRGAAKLLEQVDAVLCECSFVSFYEGQPLFPDIAEFLEQRGFSITAGAISAATERRWEQGDFLFERKQVQGESLLGSEHRNAAAPAL